MEEYENLINRYFQMDHVLEKISLNKPDRMTRLIWKKFNTNTELNLRNVLCTLTFNGTAIPYCSWRKMEEITTESGKEETYSRNLFEIDQLIGELKSNKYNRVRELLMIIKILGHCQGRDVRCITEWCREFSVENIQLYTSSPMFFKLKELKLSLKDVFQPKYYILKYVNKYIDYQKIDRLVLSQYIDKVECSNENELFSILLDQLEEEEIQDSIKYALTVISESDLFNCSKIEERIGEDMVFKFQIFWLGNSLKTINEN